jgi:DNA-binding PadR family transcriptional regulator
LAKVLKTTEKSIQKSIEDLLKNKYIEKSKTESGDEAIKVLTPTKKGDNELEENPAKTVNIQVLYDYQPLIGLKPIIETTRDFCRELITLDRFYSRADIELISSEVGYNVWEHRGGFWRIKGTDETLDHCRHRWVRNIVKTES